MDMALYESRSTPAPIEYSHFIAGEWKAGTSRETIPLMNPATGNMLATIASGTPADIDRAVAAANDAAALWAGSDPGERQALFIEIARRLRAGEAPSAVVSELARPALPAQALAFDFGHGRVAVLGEAGMLTAQIVRFDDGRPPVRFGLNTEGHDDQQFALNLMHWLSRLAP